MKSRTNRKSSVQDIPYADKIESKHTWPLSENALPINPKSRIRKDDSSLAIPKAERVKPGQASDLKDSRGPGWKKPSTERCGPILAIP